MALLPAKQLDPAKIEQAIRLLLDGLGQSDKPEVMENTPRRVADLYSEWFNPGWVDVDTDVKTFGNPNDGSYNDLVIVNDVHYTSLCEHHLMPAFGVAHFAYVPGSKVVGYSKAKKALNYLARQPQLNERILVDALDFLQAALEPVWLGLILQSVHCCIAVRSNGPAQELVTVQGFRGVDRPYTDEWRRELVQSALARRPLFLGQ